MPPQFNPAQQAIIDQIWGYRNISNRTFGRPLKGEIRGVWVALREIGPEFSCQEIGRYYANRAAAEEGRSRATRKTPEQLSMLQRAFDNDPYPTTLEQISLVFHTGLEQKQVKAWFENERKKCKTRGRKLLSRNEDNDCNDSAKLWREFKSDPNIFMRKYCGYEASSEEEDSDQNEEEMDEDSDEKDEGNAKDSE